MNLYMILYKFLIIYKFCTQVYYKAINGEFLALNLKDIKQIYCHHTILISIL